MKTLIFGFVVRTNANDRYIEKKKKIKNPNANIFFGLYRKLL